MDAHFTRVKSCGWDLGAQTCQVGASVWVKGVTEAAESFSQRKYTFQSQVVAPMKISASIRV